MVCTRGLRAHNLAWLPLSVQEGFAGRSQTVQKLLRAGTPSEIITACVSDEFQIQRLKEHPHLNREEDYAIYENQAAHLPLGYTLVVQAV